MANLSFLNSSEKKCDNIHLFAVELIDRTEKTFDMVELDLLSDKFKLEISKYKRCSDFNDVYLKISLALIKRKNELSRK